MVRASYLSLLLAVFFATLCSASENSAVGKWNCVADNGRGAAVHSTITINSSGTRLVGQMNEQGSMSLIEPTLNGDVLSFSSFVNPGCTLVYNLKANGSKMEGGFTCPEMTGTMKCTNQEMVRAGL